jgi:hypothetical protein
LSAGERGDRLLCSAYMPQKSAPKTAREAAFKSLKAKVTQFKEKGHAIDPGEGAQFICGGGALVCVWLLGVTIWLCLTA